MNYKVYVEATLPDGQVTHVTITGARTYGIAKQVAATLKGRNMQEVRKVVSDVIGLSIEMRHGKFSDDPILGATA